MAPKQNILKKQLPLILIAATGVLLVLIYFVYRGLTHNKCDSIFQQTADKLGGSLEVIKFKGSLLLGQEKIQELAEGSQKVALHLKTCCIAQDAGNMSGDQFQVCINGAREYEAKIAQVATNISEARAAQEQGNAQLVQQKTEQARQSASAATTTEKQMENLVKPLPPITLPIKSGSEQEPNHTILQANVAEMGTGIAGEIAPANDVDFFQFQYRDAKNRRDIIAVRLENHSPTLRPSVALYNEDKSLAREWSAANADGANLELSFSAEPGKRYYVAVASNYSLSAGKYTLSVVPQKAYDQYEPNDDAFTASPIRFGQTIEANITERSDLDVYRLSGVNGTSVTVRLENQSNTLRPSIRVLSADKALARNWEAANTEGADLTFSFAAAPGQEYFLEVGATYGVSAGRYKLSTH